MEKTNSSLNNVIITGVSSGIGKAIAREFAKDNSRLVVVENELGLKTANELQHLFGDSKST